jgi:hypothetical protein
MALGRSSTPGRVKTLRASSSTHHLGLWVLLQLGVWVVVGVVLRRDLLLFDKVLSFIP